MKVNEPNAGAIQNSETAGAKQSKRTSKSGGSSVEKNGAEKNSVSGAKAEISPRGKEFARAKEAASNAPDIREDRVQALKQKIADGKYNIDAHGIADRMVDEHMKTL
jgi:negative regulator of flagellin synthesis FlgM